MATSFSKVFSVTCMVLLSLFIIFVVLPLGCGVGLIAIGGFMQGREKAQQAAAKEEAEQRQQDANRAKAARIAREIALEKAQKEREDQAHKELLEEMKTVASFQRWAREGRANFQFYLAERYLSGKGVETNSALAKFWLECACTNGYAPASNLLLSIKNH